MTNIKKKYFETVKNITEHLNKVLIVVEDADSEWLFGQEDFRFFFSIEKVKYRLDIWRKLSKDGFSYDKINYNLKPLLMPPDKDFNVRYIQLPLNDILTKHSLSIGYLVEYEHNLESLFNILKLKLPKIIRILKSKHTIKAQYI